MNSGGEEEKNENAVLDYNLINSIDEDDKNDKVDLKEKDVKCSKTEDSTEEINIESYNLEDSDIIDEVNGDIVNSNLQETKSQSDETSSTREKEDEEVEEVQEKKNFEFLFEKLPPKEMSKVQLRTAWPAAQAILRTHKLNKCVKSRASSETEAKHQKKAGTRGTTNKSNISLKLKSVITTVNEPNIPRSVRSTITGANVSPDKSTPTGPQIKRESKKCSVFNRISYPPLPNDALQYTLDKTFGYDLASGPIWHMDNSYNIKNDKKFKHFTSKEDCQHMHISHDANKPINTCEKQAVVNCESDVEVFPMVENAELELLRSQLYEKAKLFYKDDLQNIISHDANKPINTCEKQAVVNCESDVEIFPMVENAELELLRSQLYEKAKLFYKDDLQNILKLHKNRRQNNIVIVTDERSKIDLSIYGKAVSVVVIPGLKLSRSSAAIKLLPYFGKGTIFVFVCGTHDLLLSVPAQSCINCEDCKEPLNLFKLPSYCDDFQLIIKKVLQLNKVILNSTKNDVAIFCGVFPVNVNQENDIRYRNRKCEMRHEIETLQFVEATFYEKYFNTIYCFNKFVNDHAEILGYKLWNFDNFKLFEQKQQQYLLIEGLYTVCSFEQENIEKEIKIKCIELYKSLIRPLMQENLEILKGGIANSIVKLTGNVEVDLNIVVNAQKGRTQSNIVIISDDRESFDTYLTGFDSRVSVAKIKHLNFENVFASMQANPKFGKGTIFVISCGTHDLLQCTPVLDCISCDCLHPAMELSLNPFSINLVKEAFKLNVELLNCTTNDIVLFSELFPVDINQYHQYHSRQCNHPLKSLPIITDSAFEKYIVDIKLYNSFVKYHAQRLSFMPWDLVSPFSEGDLSRILIADGYNIRESEGLRRGDVAKLRCKELIHNLTHSSHAVGSKFKNLNVVSTTHTDIKQISDVNCEKIARYDHIILVTDRRCMPYIKHFRKRSVSFLIIDNGLAIEDLGKFISQRQNILTPKTLYFLVIGIHYVTKTDSAKVCLENKCHNSLQITIDSDSARTGQSDFIKHLTISLHDSLNMAKSYLPLSSDMAILPALPVSFINLSNDHERLHKMAELFPDYLLCDPKSVSTYEKWVQYLSCLSVASINTCIKKNYAELVKTISAVNYLKEMKGLPDDKPNFGTWKDGIQEIINDALKTLLPNKIKNSVVNEEETFVSIHQPMLKMSVNADIVPSISSPVIVETVMLPDAIVGYVVGHRAETIRKLSTISGAKMYIDQDNSKPNVEKHLVITGEPLKPDDCDTCQHLLADQQGAFVDRRSDLITAWRKINGQGHLFAAFESQSRVLHCPTLQILAKHTNLYWQTTQEMEENFEGFQTVKGPTGKAGAAYRDLHFHTQPRSTNGILKRSQKPTNVILMVEMAKKLVKEHLLGRGINLVSLKLGKQIEKIGGRKHKLGSKSRWLTSQTERSTGEERLVREMVKYEGGNQQGIGPMEGDCHNGRESRKKEIGVPNAPPGMPIKAKFTKTLYDDYDSFSPKYKRSNETFDYLSRSTEQNVLPGEQPTTSKQNRSRSRTSRHRSISPKHNRAGSRVCSSTQNKRQRLSSSSYKKISNSRSPEVSRSKYLRHSRSRPLRRSRSRSSRRSRRSRSLKRSKRSQSFRRSRPHTLKYHRSRSRSRSLKSNESSKYLHDQDKNNFSSSEFHDQGFSQKSAIHGKNEEKDPEYCKNLLSDYYVSKPSSINLGMKESSTTAHQALEVDDTQLRNQLCPELFDKYKESLLELQHSFEEEFSVYKHIPEFHPNYESHYSDFISKQHGNKNEEELEKLFKLYWKFNYESIKNSDWKDKKQNVIRSLSSKVKLPKVEDELKLRKQHQQDKCATNINYFDFEQGLALLESVCDKITILGSSVKEMISASRAFGINSSESYKVFTDPENVAMLYIVVKKLKDLSKEANNDVSRIIYDKALDCVPKLLEVAKKGPSYNKDYQEAIIDSIDMEAIAKVSIGNGLDFTLDIIKAALSYEGIRDPSNDVLHSIYVKVCNLHLTMANNK